LAKATSKTRKSPLTHLRVSLEAIEYCVPLGLILPEVPKESLLVGVVLTHLLQASLDEPLNVGRVKC
jgi:hypothetical protein